MEPFPIDPSEQNTSSSCIDVNPKKLDEIHTSLMNIKDRELPYNPLPFYKQFLYVQKMSQEELHNMLYSGGLPTTYALFGNLMFRPSFGFTLDWGSSWYTMQSYKWPKHCQIMEKDFF